VAFTEQRLAQNAKRIFNGVRFDPFAANILRITYAKQNSKSKALPPEFYPKCVHRSFSPNVFCLIYIFNAIDRPSTYRWHEITGANDEERANRSGSGANSANNVRRMIRCCHVVASVCLVLTFSSSLSESAKQPLQFHRVGGLTR